VSTIVSIYEYKQVDKNLQVSVLNTSVPPVAVLNLCIQHVTYNSRWNVDHRFLFRNLKHTWGARSIPRKRWGTLESVALATPLTVNRPPGVGSTATPSSSSPDRRLCCGRDRREPTGHEDRSRRKWSQNGDRNSVATHEGPRYRSV
jgi:hypothetical protein